MLDSKLLSNVRKLKQFTINLNISLTKNSKKVIKVKRALSLLVIIFIIFSNAALAQYDSSGADPGSYEGRPIDPSREGIDYQREGDIIVYRNEGHGQNNQRFGPGEMNEEELRAMAKAKMGSSFSEEEFQALMDKMRS